MWPSSLAGRLLLSALIGMLAAGVAAAAIFVSFACLRDTNYLIDATLEDELDNLEESVQVDGNGRLVFRPQWSSDSYDALRKDTAFRIIDADGTTLFSHSPRGGVVTLEVTPGGFTVVDQGAGVDPADREHVFKRFWRASSATDGAGLGLAIVREICHAHRWEVWVEDAQGGGSRFVVAIPDTPTQEA